ncbi:MAG: phosphatidate cytidylyltransferase [Alphaproteobacteria bacterium]|nr:phosphatidate cytidylyltransferase [Alphaproteobacteria bacterium]
MSMVQKETAVRLITALILLPLLVVIWFGGITALILSLIFVLFMSAELALSARAYRLDLTTLLIITAIAMPLLLSLMARHMGFDPAALYMVGTVMAIAIVFIGLFSFRHISGLVMMILLTGLGLSLIELLRFDDGGVWLVLGLVTIASVDTMGFLVGRRVGGVKLWPAISPAKTWSGAIGGIVFSPLAILLYLILSGGDVGLALLALPIGVVAIAGDLIESWYKRSHSLKDIGRLLPGHGGLLDRFDGSLLALPLLYLMLDKGWLG